MSNKTVKACLTGAFGRRNYIWYANIHAQILLWQCKILWVYCHVYGRLYKMGLGWDDWIYGQLTHKTRDYRQYSAITILHTFQFTVTHALGISGFTSRILVTDLSQSHRNFKSHMKSSLLHLIPFFFALFCDCQFRRLDSIQFLCSQAHISAGWRLEAWPFTSDSTTTWLLFYTPSPLLCPFINPRHGPHRKHSLYC
jgi:hypothetical protein